MARPRKQRSELHKRNNGYWYITWYDERTTRTHRVSTGTKDEREAQRIHAERILAGKLVVRSDAGLTVTQALQLYVDRHVKPNVVDKERQYAAIANLKAYFGTKLVADIDIAASKGYAAARKAGVIGGGNKHKPRAATDATIRRELVCLVAAANCAVEWGDLNIGQLPKVELPSEIRSNDVKFFTKEQLRAIIAAAAEHDADLHDFIVLAYYTASRRAAIEDLTAAQVNLATSRINLMPAGARVTNKRKPVVPIYAEIRSIVERRMMASTDGRLFPPNANFYKRFVTLSRKLGFEGHPHMLRHSRATHMLMDGEDIYKVARLLGDNIKTVDDVYGHFVPEFLNTKSNVG